MQKIGVHTIHSFFKRLKIINYAFWGLVALFTGKYFSGGVKILAKKSGVTLYMKLAYVQVYMVYF